jgi:DNA-binding protein HU-beta
MTMNRSELVKLVARQTAVDPDVVDGVFAAMQDMIARTLTTEEEVAIRGFGKFRPVHRKSAQLVNPRTQEPMVIPPRRTVIFCPSVGLKERLNASNF